MSQYECAQDDKMQWIDEASLSKIDSDSDEEWDYYGSWTHWKLECKFTLIQLPHLNYNMYNNQKLKYPRNEIEM